MIWFAAATAVFLVLTRPAWVTLVLAGLATAAVQLFGPDWIGSSNIGLAHDLASPRLIIAAGLLAWAARYKSWRMGAAAVVFGVLALVVDQSFVLALALFTAAAMAAAPRRPVPSGPIALAGLALGLTYLGYTPLRGVIFAWPDAVWLAVGVTVLLAVAAPKPAWVALAVGGFGALAAYTVTLQPTFLLNACLQPGAVCGSQPGWYATEDADLTLTVGAPRLGESVQYPGDSGILGRGYGYGDMLEFNPVWFIVAGVLVWAVRRRSWRVAVAGAVFGVAVWAVPEQAALLLFAAAAAAIGPRRDAHYLAGIGVLVLALTDQNGTWTLAVTIVAIAVGLALGIWALTQKNGVNGAIALIALAVAPLTPFLTAGVLLATPLLRRAARWGGTPNRSPAR